MSWPRPWDPDRSQVECSNGTDCCARNAADDGGMLVVAITVDAEGRCVQCVARDRVPSEPEGEPAQVALPF